MNDSGTKVAKVTRTTLIIASSRLRTKDGHVYQLSEDHTNTAGDYFLKNEALVLFNTDQLARPNAVLGDPAITFWEIVDD